MKREEERLKIVSSREAIDVFTKKLNYVFSRMKGSHIILTCPNKNNLVIPEGKVVPRGTLRQIIQRFGITIEQFNTLIKE